MTATLLQLDPPAVWTDCPRWCSGEHLLPEWDAPEHCREVYDDHLDNGRGFLIFLSAYAHHGTQIYFGDSLFRSGGLTLAERVKRNYALAKAVVIARQVRGIKRF